MATTKNYLRFTMRPPAPKRKTSVWDVSNISGGHLGTITWFAQWRRYVFSPGWSLFFDAACLTELATFCQNETTAYKSKPKA